MDTFQTADDTTASNAAAARAEVAPATAGAEELTPAAATPAMETPATETPATEMAATEMADIAADAGGQEEIHRVQYAPVQEGPAGQPLGNIEYLKDVNLEAGVELGTTSLSVEQILKLGVGSIVELNQTVGEPVRLLINNHIYALGEVVVIGEKFGVRIGKLMHVGGGLA